MYTNYFFDFIVLHLKILIRTTLVSNPRSAIAARSVGARREMGDSHHTWLKARKVFVRMLSSEGGASVGCDTLLDASDLAKRLCKLIISCRKASALEHELDHSGIRVTPRSRSTSLSASTTPACSRTASSSGRAGRSAAGVPIPCVPTTRWSRP